MIAGALHLSLSFHTVWSFGDRMEVRLSQRGSAIVWRFSDQSFPKLHKGLSSGVVQYVLRVQYSMLPCYVYFCYLALGFYKLYIKWKTLLVLSTVLVLAPPPPFGYSERNKYSSGHTNLSIDTFYVVLDI